MSKILFLVGMAILLSGCCNITGGTGGAKGENLNSCLADCERNSVGQKGLAGLGSCKALCYDHEARATGDAAQCDAINSLGNVSMMGEDTSFWFNGCVGDVAEDKKDVTVCGRLPVGPRRDACIMNVYYATKNPSDCDGLSDPREKSVCQ
ncbi:MAG: hypothetical protein U0R44_01165 [Candidatus Micrarchaeia archaeon]